MLDAPYNLTNGLCLEQSGALLPWFQSLHQITKLGGKPSPGKGRVTQLFWEQETVLGGLQVSILAMSRGSGIFFLTPIDRFFPSAQEEFSSLLLTLNNRLGEPHESGETEGYPWVRWRWGDICLNLAIGERFVDYMALSVSKGVIKQ